jgi:serine/threonine-protein kinase
MAEQVLSALAAALRRRYTIQREVGRGGTAFVFLAHDLKHDRPVAIKVLRPEIAVALGVERFLREIRLAAQLQHPHIMPLYDSGEAGGWLYYVMPHVEGRSLRQRLDEHGPLPLEDALRITAEVCDALGYAHRQGIVHRDIKPENILFTGEHALVADFGLARAITAAGGEKLSETGITVGTPAYMSPEQAGAEDRIDGRSDLYSLGCVLYEMLAGGPPFTGPSAQAVLARQAVDPVPPLRTVRKAVPPHVERAVMRALEKVPADRFPSADQFAQAVSSPASVQRRPFRSARAVALLIGAAALLVAAGWLALRAREASAPRIRRIAVLPLQNLTGDSTQGVFVDGMHEALLNQLARIRAVTVISRSSVLRYRGTERPPLPQISRALGVDGIIDGSVFRTGDSVRVSLELIEGRTDRHVWAATYARDLRDVLRLQGELATAIAAQIRVAVTPGERSRFAHARQVDPEVYTLALKGGYECGLWTERGLRLGIRFLRQAVDGDPDFAPAYARLAGCYSDLAFFGYASPTEVNPMAKAAAARAVELDSTLGEDHSILGWIRFVTDLDFDRPDRDFRRALELSPGSAVIRRYYADYLTLAGRWDEAISQGQRAIQLDPLSAPRSVGLGWTYFKARRYDESIAQLTRTLVLEPDYGYAHMELAWNYSEKEMPDAAVAHCDSAIAQIRDPVTAQTCGWVYGRAGRRQQALAMLRQLTADSSRHWLDPMYSAMVYTGLGDRDRAIALLQQAAREHSQDLVFLKVDPLWDPLRSDPRFKALLRELGIAS